MALTFVPIDFRKGTYRYTDFLELPPRLRSSTLLESEIEAINSGGGSETDALRWVWHTKLERIPTSISKK